MIGKRLANRYEIQRRIGEGGMAIVYRAHDAVLDRPVAVKVLRAELARDEDFVRRFRREARAAASLSHPNIVAIFDVGRDRGCEFIVMEYVEGRTLKEKIRREAPLPVAVAVSLAKQILYALDHAHRHGVVHRDVKPQNILLTRSGQVKLTDLGIARATGFTTLVEPGAVLGTAQYIAPEQARGEPSGAQSDLYSLGVVLYEMLTGRLPFDGESPVAVAMKHVQEPPPPPRVFNPAVPPGLEAIVLKALEKDPRDRYASAAEFLEDLIRYRTLAPEAVRARRLEAEPTMRLVPVARLGGAAVGAAPAAAPQPQGEAEPEPAAARPATARRSRRLPAWLLWGALVAAVFLLASGAAYTLSLRLTPPLVTVPDLRGMTVARARQVLQPYGVELTVISELHRADAPAGTVVDQDPRPGEPVRRGGRVGVVVSLGPEAVPGGMPDLRGAALRDAELRLRALGLTPSVERVTSETVPRDRVVDQRPRPGEPVDVGATVTLYVSAGPPAAAFALPDLRGRTLDEARAELGQLGLLLRNVGSEASDYPRDQVVRQVPAPGTLVRPGDPVDLTVSAGNGLVPHRDDVAFTLPEQPEAQQVLVLVRDERGERVVRSGPYGGGEELVVAVYWYGSEATVHLLVDGREVEVVHLTR